MNYLRNSFQSEKKVSSSAIRIAPTKAAARFHRPPPLAGRASLVAAVLHYV
jgi:hypothetical protein